MSTAPDATLPPEPPAAELPRPDAAPAIAVSSLTVHYGRELVLDDVSVVIPSGAITGIIGPNGAGKSTLVGAIMGATPPTTGAVRILGHPLREVRRDVAWVPQRAAVDWDFPITVRDVVAQGRYPHLGLWRRATRECRAAIDEALARTGLTPLAGRRIGELSGGQQQRTFLARALAQRARVYLLDEPFAGVDATTESAIMDVLRTLRGEGRTVVVVHHDLATARGYFEHLLLLNRRVIAAGPSATTFTREHLEATYGARLAVLDSGQALVTP